MIDWAEASMSDIYLSTSLNLALFSDFWIERPLIEPFAVNIVQFWSVPDQLEHLLYKNNDCQQVSLDQLSQRLWSSQG